MAQLNVFLYFLYFFLQKLGRNPRNTIDTSLDLGTILSKWTWPDRREEIGKTVEAVLEVLWPGQPEVKAAADSRGVYPGQSFTVSNENFLLVRNVPF